MQNGKIKHRGNVIKMILVTEFKCEHVIEVPEAMTRKQVIDLMYLAYEAGKVDAKA